MSGEPFHRCTHTALSPHGRHLRVRRLRQRARAQVLARRQAAVSRGASRAAIPGSSTSRTTSAAMRDGWVYVADRENHRVQVFDGNGKYEAQWNNMHRPCGSVRRGEPRTACCYIGEIGPRCRSTATCPTSARASASSTTRASCSARVGDMRARPAPEPVHRAARPRGRLARRPVRGRGVVHRVVADLSEHAAARGPAQPAQAGAGGRLRRVTRTGEASGADSPTVGVRGTPSPFQGEGWDGGCAQ